MKPSVDYFRFGIPSLDHLFAPAAEHAKDWRQWGIQLPKKKDGTLGTTSLSFIGRSGTGKSVLGLHLASRYLADARKEKPDNLPKVFYISTDLTYARGSVAWSGFGLDQPNQRKVPFGEEAAFQDAEASSEEKGLRIELVSCPFGEQELTEALLNQPPEPTTWFVDLASSTAGDDWGLLMRLLALLPPPAPGAPKHLVVIDAVEGLETMSGSVDVHGHERSRRSRIAQVLRTAGDKCHVAFVLEETVAGSTPDEEFVTDVVIRLWAKEEHRYLRRTLEVTKSRGSSHVRGNHHYLIRDGKGIAGNPDEPVEIVNAYFYLVDSLHWLTRMKMMAPDTTDQDASQVSHAGQTTEPPNEQAKLEKAKQDAQDRYKKYAWLHMPKLTRTLPYNGLPRGEVTALTGDEATYKGRLGRAFLAGAFRQEPREVPKGHPFEFPTEAVVYLTTHNLTQKTLIEKLRWHLPSPPHQTGQVLQPPVPLTPAEQALVVFRQLEAHNLDSATLFHIIRRAVEDGIRRLAKHEGPSGPHSDWQWWKPDGDNLSKHVRVVIDDWTTIKSSYPQVAADTLFLPFLVRYLEEKGVAALIVETCPGRPDEIFSRDSQKDLRSLVRNHLMTWHVRFFGDDRVALAAIPPLSDALGPAVSELSAPPPKQLWSEEKRTDERLWANPHFELYTGLERGLPQAIPLAVNLFACAEKSPAYRAQLNALFNRMFTPQPEQQDVVQGFAPAEYAALREYSQLVGGVRASHTTVMQVDEYWQPPPHAPALPHDDEPTLLLEPYIQQPTTDARQNHHLIHDPHAEFQPAPNDKKMETPQQIKRRYRHEFFWLPEYGENWHEEAGRLHLAPFLWDFGFLLLRDKLWRNAEAVLKAGNATQQGYGLRVEKVRKQCLHPGFATKQNDQQTSFATSTMNTVSWEEFFRACKWVAENQPSGVPMPAFDLDLLTPQTFAALVLEIWASYIFDKTKGQSPLPFHSERHTTKPSAKSLSDLLSEYSDEFFKVWLLLGEVIPTDQVLHADGTMQARTARSEAVAERHWFSTSGHLGEKHGKDDPYLIARLPGHYSTRGDWFLTLGAESRSRQLGERAMDLLCRRKDNIARLEHGIGLPVRKFGFETDDQKPAFLYDYLRIPHLIRDASGSTVQPASYADLRRLGACKKNEHFYWLWRSQIRHYHEQDRLWERWLARFMKESGTWNRKLKQNKNDGFQALRWVPNHAEEQLPEIYKEFKQMVNDMRNVLDKFCAAPAQPGTAFSANSTAPAHPASQPATLSEQNSGQK